MPAGVVVEIDRRVAEIVCERRTVIVAIASPLAIVHAQSMDQHHDLAPGIGVRSGQRIPGDRDCHAGPAHVHRDRQGIAGRDQVVSEHAIERRQNRLAFLRGRSVREQWNEHAEHGIDTDSDEARHATHRLVDQARDPGGSSGGRLAQDAGRPGNGVVQRFHDVGQSDRGLVGKPMETAQIRQANVNRLCHEQAFANPTCGQPSVSVGASPHPARAAALLAPVRREEG